MFGGFEAALVFLLLVMPGLLLIGGYYGGLGRPQALSSSAVHTLAQAIAWSAILLIPAAILLANDIADWIDTDTVDQHLTSLFIAGYATLLVPFPVGLLIGLVARRRERLAKVFGSGTGWGVVADGRGELTKVRVSIVDSAAPITGQLVLRDSRLAPGGSLTLREVENRDDPPDDIVVASEQVLTVEFLDPSVPHETRLKWVRASRSGPAAAD